MARRQASEAVIDEHPRLLVYTRILRGSLSAPNVEHDQTFGFDLPNVLEQTSIKNASLDTVHKKEKKKKKRQSKDLTHLEDDLLESIHPVYPSELVFSGNMKHGKHCCDGHDRSCEREEDVV